MHNEKFIKEETKYHRMKAWEYIIRCFTFIVRCLNYELVTDIYTYI